MFLNDLKIIPVVAETKSFSKAGKLLHFSQPTISNKIQAMETYHGVKLFKRTPQGVLPKQVRSFVLMQSGF